MFEIQNVVARGHIDALLTEAQQERTARSARGTAAGPVAGGGLRSHLGRALIAVGAFIAGEPEPAPHGRTA